jgi:L-rhamnose-H+ transport protein
MNALFGVIFHFIGGFASGSFYIPYKKVRGWAWESYWIIGGLFSWLIVPPLAAWLTIPNFSEIIAGAGTSTLFYTYLFGLLWGIGGLTYGLGVRYLGVSLGSSIILGLCMVFGALIPSIYYDLYPAAGKDTFSLLTGTGWGRVVLSGLAVCVLGIIICGKAGMRKEKELSAPLLAKESGAENPVALDSHGNEIKTEYKFGLGILVSVISGVLSACFNFGLEAGKPMAELANELWKNANPSQGEFLYQNNVTYVVVLWGGLTTNLIWCLLLNARNKTFGDYTRSSTPLLRNYLFSALAGTTWFLQFFFYGMGESKLGNGPSSWILHMAFIILVANMWGLVLKEWKGTSRKTVSTIIIGIITIILAVLIVGYGNSLKD